MRERLVSLSLPLSLSLSLSLSLLYCLLSLPPSSTVFSKTNLAGLPQPATRSSSCPCSPSSPSTATSGLVVPLHPSYSYASSSTSEVSSLSLIGKEGIFPRTSPLFSNRWHPCSSKRWFLGLSARSAIVAV